MGDRAGSIPVTRIERAALSSLESETKGLLHYNGYFLPDFGILKEERE